MPFEVEDWEGCEEEVAITWGVVMSATCRGKSCPVRNEENKKKGGLE